MGMVTCRVKSTWLLLSLTVESLGWLCIGHILWITNEFRRRSSHRGSISVMKPVWSLNRLATEFHSLAIFYKLCIPSLICISPVCPTKGEKWPTLCQPRSFYSQPGQLPCACHPMPKPLYLPLFHTFYRIMPTDNMWPMVRFLCTQNQMMRTLVCH